MQSKIGLTAAALLAFALAAPARLAAQGSPQTPARPGSFRATTPFPAMQRPPGDPAQIERGKTLYGINCRGCHGADLRGGDIGGPNLLRSQLVQSDQDGELIVPVIEGSRAGSGMPAIKMAQGDAKLITVFIRSVIAGVGRQGTPPSIGVPVPTIVVGDATAGSAYFDTKCASCHTPAGDLKGIAKRISDPKALQNAWVSGGGGGRGRGPAPAESNARTVTVSVAVPGGKNVEGRLVRIDDFIVTVGLADGTMRTIRRIGDTPKVTIKDPMKAHRDLLQVYTDKDIHDVTAFLVTLK